MTPSTMTSPSARRSPHHCSPRSEKMMRAVDEPIILLTKGCRPVSRRLSVLFEQGDLFLISLIHLSPTSEKINVATQKMSNLIKITSLQKDEFYNSLQSCSQVHSDASRFQKSRRKGSSGEGMEKPTWQLTKVRNKNEVIAKASNKGSKVHFASLMDLCHLKDAELLTKHPKKQRVE